MWGESAEEGPTELAAVSSAADDDALRPLQLCGAASGFEIGPPAGLSAAEGLISMFSLVESGRNPARATDFWPGSNIA